jgi:hypothetical protein
MRLFHSGGFLLLLIATAGLTLAAADPVAPAGVTRDSGRSARFSDSSDSQSLAAPPSGVVEMPVVSSRTYRMLAKVRPLLFWISRDDVGGARIRWRGDDRGAFGLDLLIGSDPERAPRRINRWGYIAEQVRGSDARVIGVMKQSNERSVADAESQLRKEAGQGKYVFRAIQGTATDHDASAAVTTVRLARDFTYRDIGPLLTLVGDGRDGDSRRTVSLPNGTRPGFLLALSDLVKESVEGYGRRPSAATEPSRRVVQYVYFGAIYDMALTSSVRLKTASIDGRRYADLARSNFEIRNRRTGEKTPFQLTYGTTGDLAGIPVHAVYRPRWWFEVQLFLDDDARI